MFSVFKITQQVTSVTCISREAKAVNTKETLSNNSRCVLQRMKKSVKRKMDQNDKSQTGNTHESWTWSRSCYNYAPCAQHLQRALIRTRCFWADVHPVSGTFVCLKSFPLFLFRSEFSDVRFQDWQCVVSPQRQRDRQHAQLFKKKNKKKKNNKTFSSRIYLFPFTKVYWWMVYLLNSILFKSEHDVCQFSALDRQHIYFIVFTV